MLRGELKGRSRLAEVFSDQIVELRVHIGLCKRTVTDRSQDDEDK